MISKDEIKELMFDAIGFKCRQEKVQLGIAAYDIMCYVAARHLLAGQSVILENNFEEIVKPKLLELICKYDCKVITIRVGGDIETILRRFIERESSPERHRGHVINTQYPEVDGEKDTIAERGISAADFEAAAQRRGMLDFAIGDLIEVDTTDFAAVNYDDIAEKVRLLMV